MFMVPAFAATSPRNQASEVAGVTCSDAEQLMNSQWRHIESDSGMILMLLHSEYACNQRSEARRLATALSEHSGDSTWLEAIFRGGQIASAGGDFDTAETLLKAIQKGYADPAALYFELGSVQLQAGKFGQAKVSYERAAQLDPTSAEVQLGLAGARVLSGYGEDALSGLDQAIRQFPNDVRFLIAYGDVLQQLPEYSEPVYQGREKQYLERAISIDRASPRAHYLLGQLLITESKFHEAISELEMAVEYQPGLKQAHFALSRVYRRVGRRSEADEQFLLFRKLESSQAAASGAAAP